MAFRLSIDYFKWGYCNGKAFTVRLMIYIIKTTSMLVDSYKMFAISPTFRLSSWETSESCKYECFWYFWQPKHFSARYWLARLQLQLLLLLKCFLFCPYFTSEPPLSQILLFLDYFVAFIQTSLRKPVLSTCVSEYNVL